MAPVIYEKTIYTIGHSTRTLEEFLNILKSFQIKALADVRNFPGSKRYPHFNKEILKTSLANNEIKYLHLKQLGGRKKAIEYSKNTAWRNTAFRGYADHMQTEEFTTGINILEKLSSSERTAFMCSEAVWWRCHRSLISDFLKVEGWDVKHIMAFGKAEVHPFTSPSKIVNGKLSYEE
ncbi:MAG: DUF488 domain-containing protein [Chitinophagales bacterium]|nr:DUF488 domain-containing protein [Chitinophagales bacterium]